MRNHLLLSHMSPKFLLVAPPNDGVHMCQRTTASKITPHPRPTHGKWTFLCSHRRNINGSFLKCSEPLVLQIVSFLFKWALRPAKHSLLSHHGMFWISMELIKTSGETWTELAEWLRRAHRLVSCRFCWISFLYLKKKKRAWRRSETQLASIVARLLTLDSHSTLGRFAACSRRFSVSQ